MMKAASPRCLLPFFSLSGLFYHSFLLFAICAARANAFCNWCYLRSCLVDFDNDFCISTCQKPPMEDGIDWQQSEGLFLQALETWPGLSPASATHQWWLDFFLESIQQLALAGLFVYSFLLFSHKPFACLICKSFFQVFFIL